MALSCGQRVGCPQGLDSNIPPPPWACKVQVDNGEVQGASSEPGLASETDNCNEPDDEQQEVLQDNQGDIDVADGFADFVSWLE